MLEPKIITDYPIAYESYDHTHPYGTKDDNTKNNAYVDELIARFGKDMHYMDVGCAGGGFVSQFIDRGVFAVGVEGSDYSKKHNRAEWATIPNYLFTADITKPFTIVDQNDQPILFDAISAFDVLEHIATPDLPKLFDNFNAHLKLDGILVLGISTAPCGPYHQTVETGEWWLAKLKELGYEETEDLVNFGREPTGPYGIEGIWGCVKRIK